MKEREDKKEKSSHASLVGPTCSLSSSISTPSPWLCERRGWGMGLTGGEGLQQARVRPWPAARAQRERWPGSTRRGRAGRQRAQWGLGTERGRSVASVVGAKDCARRWSEASDDDGEMRRARGSRGEDPATCGISRPHALDARVFVASCLLLRIAHLQPWKRQ